MPDTDPKTPRDVAVGKDVLLILGHRWFEKQLGSALDRGMAELLIAVYVHSERGTPLSKKSALQFVAVSDVKTARKYLARCIELEWIEATRSEADKRVELLRPSRSMHEVIREELLQLAETLARLEPQKPSMWGETIIRPSKSDLRIYIDPREDQEGAASNPPNTGSKKK